MSMKHIAGWPVVLCLALGASVCDAQAQTDFYRGKTIELDIGTSVGGGYDAYGRMVARYMARYIPGNPTIVPKNMEGGGGIRLGNFIYGAAAKDGTVIATFNRGVPFEPLLSSRTVPIDATKYNWIGSTNDEISICASWHTTGITTLEQVRMTELVVGATGPSGDTYQFPKVSNAVLGTKFKIVTGYPGGNDVDLAMERGEVQGRCGWSWTSVKATHAAWLDRKQINILYQMGLSKHRDLPNVPLVTDFAKTDEERAILKLIFARQVMAWPYAAPPGVPKERVEILRRAFMETMKDKDFLADAEKANLEITPVSGEAIQKLVQEIYDTPAGVVRKTAAMLQ
jgi:hypothetical protein